MSEILITADQHFAHPNVLRHAKRPFIKPGDLTDSGQWVSKEIANKRCAEMDDCLIEEHNALATQSSTTYCIGDMAWRNHRHYIKALKGHKIIILGSHDKMNQETLRCFTEVHTLLKRTFFDNTVLTYMVHCTPRTWDSRTYGALALSGHVHAGFNSCLLPNSWDCGVDSAYQVVGKYRPFRLEEIVDICKNGHPKVRFIKSIFEDPEAISDEEEEAQGSGPYPIKNQEE